MIEVTWCRFAWRWASALGWVLSGPTRICSNCWIVYVGVDIEIEKTSAARSAGGSSCSSLLLSWKKPCCRVRHSSAPGITVSCRRQALERGESGHGVARCGKYMRSPSCALCVF